MNLVWEQLGISMFAAQQTDYGRGPTHQYLITPQEPLRASWQAWYVVTPQSREIGTFPSLEAGQEACSAHLDERLESVRH